MNEKRAEILLASVIIARSTSLLFSKISLAVFGPFNLLAVRFGLAFAILAVIAGKRWRRLTPAVLGMGALLGLTFFAVMALEMQALMRTDSSTTSFLENTAIVWVPLMSAAIGRRRPSGTVIGASGLTLLGVGCLTVGKSGFSIGTGQMICLAASLFYAGAIVMTARFSKKGDALMLGIIQIGVMALCAGIASFMTETPRLPAALGEMGPILYLAVICSVFGFTLQPVAQKRISAEKAGLFCALSPLSASLMGIIFLHESVSGLSLAGSFLILAGILGGSGLVSGFVSHMTSGRKVHRPALRLS